MCTPFRGQREREGVERDGGEKVREKEGERGRKREKEGERVAFTIKQKVRACSKHSSVSQSVSMHGNYINDALFHQCQTNDL